METRTKRKPVKQAEHVVLGDLLATLAAHRESNSLRQIQEQANSDKKANSEKEARTVLEKGRKAVTAENDRQKPADQNTPKRVAKPRKFREIMTTQRFLTVKANSRQSRGLAVINPKSYSRGNYVPPLKYEGDTYVYQPWKRQLGGVQFVDKYER